MVLSQSLGYLCSYMKFKFLFFLSASKSKSLQLFLQKKEVECDIIGIRTAVLETETNSLYHYTNGIRLQVMFSFCIFIVCLVKVKKPLKNCVRTTLLNVGCKKDRDQSRRLLQGLIKLREIELSCDISTFAYD